jgi:hypothetical protein
MDGVDFCGSVFLFLIPHFSFFVFLTVFLALFSSFYSFFLLLLLSSRIPEAWRIVYIIVRYASNKNSSSFGNFTFLLAESKTLVTYVHPSNTSGLVISGEGRSDQEKLLLNSLFIITLRAGVVPPGDSLEFPARRHGAGSRCQLRKVEAEREEVV